MSREEPEVMLVRVYRDDWRKLNIIKMDKNYANLGAVIHHLILNQRVEAEA